MSKPVNTQLTIRERFCLLFVVFAIKLLQPWEYEHQFRPLLDAIYAEMGVEVKP